MARSTSLAARGAVAVLAAVSLTGCGGVRQAVGRVLGGGPDTVVDAHAVTLLRPGCTTVAARTIRHGYSVLTPSAGTLSGGTPLVVEPAGLFEGPALVGTFVFRYVPPHVGETWDEARAAAETTETRVAVAAVDVELPDVRAYLDRFCGPAPPGEGETGEPIPRVPRTP